MTDAPPPLILGPELLAHMREHPDSELARFASTYLQLGYF